MLPTQSPRDQGDDRVAIALLTVWAALSVSVVTSGGWLHTAQPAMVQAVASQVGSSALVPYESLADVPRGAWFKRRGPAHLADIETWYQVGSVNSKDGSLGIARQYVTPDEMLERWQYTLDPFAPNPVILRCGKPAPAVIPAPNPVIPAKAGVWDGGRKSDIGKSGTDRQDWG